MNVHLLHEDRDFDLGADTSRRDGPRARPEPPAPREQALRQDLELDTLINAMAAGDAFLSAVAGRALLTACRHDVSTVRYRQQVLRDCLRQGGVVREIYALALEAVERNKKLYYRSYSRLPSTILYESVEALQIFVGLLAKLRDIADRHAGEFASKGFTNLLAMIQREFTDDYFEQVKGHLRELKFKKGVLISAELGPGNEGTHHVLRLPGEAPPNWFERVLGQGPPAYTFSIDPRDEAGARAVSELQDRGINEAANALAQSADHVLGFFELLRTELAFYLGCLNLHERLSSLGVPLCYPQPEPSGTRSLRLDDLCDVSLSLTLGHRAVGNAVDADGKSLVIVTGANQGGKSTFLRSVGQAQLMMQSGMFVCAAHFTGELTPSLFTHYKREEDTTMKSGKLDEELSRMSAIVDDVTANAMLLCNESFASTDDREGSEIARQIVNALLDRGLRILFVTHLHDFARRSFDAGRADALFLRAERLPDGTRSFKVVEGEPLETSFGADLYRTVFG